MNLVKAPGNNVPINAEEEGINQKTIYGWLKNEEKLLKEMTL